MNNGGYGNGQRNTEGEFSHVFAEGAYRYGANPFSPPPPKGKTAYVGLAIASLVLGVASLAAAALVHDPITAMILAPGGIAFFAVFTAIHRKLDPKAFVGIACSAAAILVSVVLFVLSALNIYDYKSLYGEGILGDYFGNGFSESGEETTQEPEDGNESDIFM